MTNVLRLPAASKVCVLLVDGLGWHLLRSHAAAALFLCSLAVDSEPITAGFPATTATSIAALGTGLPRVSTGLSATPSLPVTSCSTRSDGTDMATVGPWIFGPG